MCFCVSFIMWENPQFVEQNEYSKDGVYTFFLSIKGWVRIKGEEERHTRTNSYL